MILVGTLTAASLAPCTVDQIHDLRRYRIELQHAFWRQQHPLIAHIVEFQAHAMRQRWDHVFAQWTRLTQEVSPSKTNQCAVWHIVLWQNPDPRSYPRRRSSVAPSLSRTQTTKVWCWPRSKHRAYFTAW